MHHAELYVGDAKEQLSHIESGDRTAGPDVFHFSERRFGIGEARMLKEMAFRTPVERKHRVFIITAGAITTEAQNALLKLFEEPPATARFYMIVPREDILIPTLRSRFSRSGVSSSVNVGDDALEFLKRPFRGRLEEIASRMKEKDEEWAERVISGAECYFSEKKDHDALAEIAFVRRYIYAPGSSKKMLLEHLALALPVPK